MLALHRKRLRTGRPGDDDERTKPGLGIGDLPRRDAIAAKAPKVPAAGTRRHAALGRDLLAGQAPLAQRLGSIRSPPWRWAGASDADARSDPSVPQWFRPATGVNPACVPSSGRSLRLVQRPPASARSAPPCRDALDPRRQTGILVDNHPVRLGD